MPRAPVAPVQILRARHGGDFYICWFQEPGVADAVLAADVRRTLIAGDAWTSAWGSAQTPATPPPWLTEEDLAVYVEAFARTGFTGALNYYRNMDRNWELTAAVEGRRVTQPALFVTGADDPVHGFMPADHLAAWVTDLRGHVVLQGAGHWIQQERPDEVNAALLGFLAGL
jgi:pimeloyl-ACP methyl ester carboxylesterase